MKFLLAALCLTGLCSCEMVPVDEMPSDERAAVAPQGRASLIDPRTYMDKPDPDLQRLLSSREFH
jgi:hypothetical protein